MRVDARPNALEEAPATSDESSSVAEPECPEDEPMCDSVERAPRGAPACFVSNDHIAREQRTIARESPTGSPAESRPWNHRSPPEHWSLVDRHLRFTPRERSLLDRNGFVALDRLSYDSYALAYHEIFRQQLPVYIGVDSVLHAAFVAHSTILQSVERRRLSPALGRMLASLRAALRANRLRIPEENRRDLDLYLSVAARLLHGESAPAPLFEQNEERVENFAHFATSGGLEPVELFGRSRMVDFSQFTPRGHYTETIADSDSGEADTLEAYFRAVQWLSRVEFNLVSRGSRSSALVVERAETPREAIDALALARLVEDAGAQRTLAEFERVYHLFAGVREDVPLPTLAQRARDVRLGDSQAFAQIRAAIGGDFRRTTRLHFTPEGAGELPAISAMVGLRVVPDVAPLEGVVHDSVAGRTSISAADIGYMLGHSARSMAMMTSEIQRFPSLIERLDEGSRELSRSAREGNDLYSRWLRAALSLAPMPSGTWPSFATTDAFRDYRLNSALVTYAQIRHNYVLLAGQGYDAYGCEIPDGYVEPAVETWDALRAFMTAARAVDPSRSAFFDRFVRVLDTLRTISLRERQGLALTASQKRWLGMVAEYIPRGGFHGDSGQPPKWTGWYFDLFVDREIGAEKAAHFIADYFTLTNEGRVRYLGAHTPAMGAFVIDTNGVPRIMVGPVARGFERSEPIANRLTDDAAQSLEEGSARWRASYATLSPTVPADDVEVFSCDDGGTRVYVRGIPGHTVEVTLLDHHGDATSNTGRARVGNSGAAIIGFDSTTSVRAEEAHVRVIHGEDRRDVTVPSRLAPAEAL